MNYPRYVNGKCDRYAVSESLFYCIILCCFSLIVDLSLHPTVQPTITPMQLASTIIAIILGNGPVEDVCDALEMQTSLFKTGKFSSSLVTLNVTNNHNHGEKMLFTLYTASIFQLRDLYISFPVPSHPRADSQETYRRLPTRGFFSACEEAEAVRRAPENC